ncbi:MAG TPA: ABC transporter permease [Chloroflexia bacterium]|jgi:peptide/nickel transport system permease protein
MVTYIIRRTLQAVLMTLFGAFFFYTLLVYVLPWGPATAYRRAAQDVRDYNITEPFSRILNSGGKPVGPRQPTPLFTVREMEEAYSLDKPWPLSFFAWLYDPDDTMTYTRRLFLEQQKGLDIWIGSLHITGDGALLGNWGYSDVVRRGVAVQEVVSGRWGNSALLVGLGLIFSVLIAVPVGMWSAVRAGSKVDHTITFFSFAGQSMPPFVLGMLLIFAAAVIPYQLHHNQGWTWLPYLPPGLTHDLDQDTNWLNRLYHLVLPVSALVLSQVAWLSRHVRFSMLDVLSKEYVRTAQAKGLRQWRVLWRHAFRNASIPFITSVALAIPGVLTGVVVIERLFAYPGMGDILFSAMNIRPDIPIILTVVVIMVFLIGIANLVADILYAVVDPRVGGN